MSLAAAAAGRVRRGARRAAEALALALVFAGASALSHSCLVLGEDGDPSCLPASFRPQSSGERLPAGRSG